VSDLDHLLELQANDTTADQLRHRRETLPERSRLAELDQQRATVDSAIVEPKSRRDELAHQQRRFEDEIGTIEAKRVSVDQQLYGGGITSPREAQAMQADLESLLRRQTYLEDQVLELMEAIEPLDEELVGAAARLAEIAAERTETEASLSAAESEIDAELTQVTAARAALVAAVSPPLVAEYERLRPQYGGVAVAKLAHGTCQGCFLTLAPAEIDELRREPADALVHCPDCGRLLVR